MASIASMASMGSYLLPFSILQRLLRFALSKVPILDSDALDLENLDLALGRKSVLEFKDTPLRLKVLANLLQLPPGFEIIRAQISFLRIHVDLSSYSLPTVKVEVDGVEAQLRVDTEMDSKNGGAAHATERSRRSRRQVPTVPGSGSNLRSEHDGISGIPTATDLAASFLETGPVEEKEELEAANISKSLAATESDFDEDDDDEETGTGTSPGLPGFLADILKGIVDRLEVTVQHVVFNVDLQVPDDNGITDPVTLQLKIDDVDMEGITYKEDDEPAANQPADHRFKRKPGQRLISLRKIRGILISEATLFMSLAKSSSLSSPSTTQSGYAKSRCGSRCSGRSKKSARQASEDFAGSTEASLPNRSPSTADSMAREEDEARMANSVAASDDSIFGDLHGEGHENRNQFGTAMDNSTSPSASRVSHSSGHMDPVSQIRSSYHEPKHDFDDSDDENALAFVSQDSGLGEMSTAPRTSFRCSLHESQPEDGRNQFSSSLQSSLFHPRDTARFSGDRANPSESSLHESLAPDDHSPAVYRESRNCEDDDSSSTTSSADEDLAQSMIFSHEEVASMYMSAIGESPTSRMPGGWDEECNGSAPAFSTPASPHSSFTLNLAYGDNPSPTPVGISDADQSPANGAPTFSANAASNAQRTIANSGRRPTTSTEPASREPPRAPKASSNLSGAPRPFSVEYTRVAKSVFALDEVAIYLPPSAKGESPVVEHCERSKCAASADSYQTNAFLRPRYDVHGATSPHSTGGGSAKTPRSEETLVPESNCDLESVEVHLGLLEAHFDVSAGRLLGRIALALSNCLGAATAPVNVSESETKTSPDHLRTKFRGEKLSLKFLDRLSGTFVQSNTYSEQERWEGPSEPDVLLQTSLEGLEVDCDLADGTIKACTSLEKFLFGYAKENIVSFDMGLRMYDSVRDVSSSKRHDITMDILKTAHSTQVSLNTLPVCVAIDLQKLDEIFTWFGGLSGVVNMGSSVASNATLTAANPGKAASKTRGVHFDAPIKSDDMSLATQNKVDVRIGGFVLQLIGQECGISFETSAVKMVSRDEAIGMGIATIRLSGPHIHHSNGEPAISAEFNGIRVEFLTAPRDTDLDRLLSLITPSNAKYDQDDDILVDTLIRQRKKGSVLRLTIDEAKTHVGQLNDLAYLPELGRELSSLSTVARYLPEDDRPGLLSLILVRKFEADVDLNETFGKLQLEARDIEVAQITLPSLMASSINSVTLWRNGSEELIGPAPGAPVRETGLRCPAIMARMIGDEMEPVIKVKLWNLKVEYSVPTLVAILGLSEHASGDEVAAELVASIATLTDGIRPLGPSSNTSRNATPADDLRSSKSTPLEFDVVIRDCVIGLNPLELPSKILVVMTEARVSAASPNAQDIKATVELNKAAILVIDDVANTSSNVTRSKRRSYDGGSTQVSLLCDIGFVSASYISSAQAIVQITSDPDGEDSCIDVELRDDLLVLESCADSTQTLIATVSGLSPPTPPSTAMKYRTKVMPMADLLASLTGDAFAPVNNDTFDFDEDFGQALDLGLDENEALDDDEENLGLGFGSHYSTQRSEADYEGSPYIDHNPSVRVTSEVSSRDTDDCVLLENFDSREQVLTSDEPLDFDEGHFETGSLYEDSTLRWNSAKMEYVRPVRAKGSKVKKNPLNVHVRDVHVIWNLFDGYDWQSTRDKIAKKVQEVETKASEKKAWRDRLSTFDKDVEDEETVIGDMLFNSIYIGIPSNRDPRELAMAINQEINNGVSETESVATTTLTSVSQRQSLTPRIKGKKLRLNRSKNHKITFELKGINADIIAFPPGSGETLNSIDVRVHDLEIFDHVPTSTWKKFAMYMHDAGEREKGANMIHIEVLNVKPDPDLTASEMVIRVTILPLRLHVDQDALDFITRFFQFKDEDPTKSKGPGEEPFLQRVEINDVRVRLNYKPKRVDYAGIRSGHTTEFKNFVILDEADMVLKHAIVFGTSGFDKLGVTLNDIWTNDVKRNQLAGILGAIGPVKSLVNVGSGVRDLFVVPMREYKKDGRVVRSLRKGVVAFAKVTGTELIKAGAKVTIGTRTYLQGAEEFINKNSASQRVPTDEEDEDEEEPKKISPYSAQPIGVMQGMRGGVRSLKRDLLMAKDAIIAVPGEVMESGSASGAAKAVLRRAPTVIIRPLMGVTGAIGQGLMGFNNSLDPGNKRRLEDQYKSG